jgi:hypothetical protein
MNPPEIEILTLPMGDAPMPPLPGVPLCDFCTGVPVSTAFRTSHRIIIRIAGKVVHDHDVAPWMACAACAPSVESRDVDVLVQRAIIATGMLMGDPFGVIPRLFAEVVKRVVERTELVLP